MSMQSSTGKVRTTYAFIRAHRSTFSIHALCRALDVAPSGYDAWHKQPLSNRALEACLNLAIDNVLHVTQWPHENGRGT